ncbi:MAG: hypothetical protein PHS16_03120 [Candidatus Colwellbacteria bacterium]|nr:hypothetical protein [Candidatus Colwellbacteria bacterium]
MIDIVSILDNLGIEYHLSGKNVSKGWVEIHCPFPYCSDPGHHCGINLQSAKFHCWVCGEKGTFQKLLSKGFDLPYREVKEMIAEFSDDEIFVPQKEETEVTIRDILPKESTKDLPRIHEQYLLKRGFDPEVIKRKYHIRACYRTGDYAYRLIIPVIEEGIVVNFTARDVTNKQEVRYQSCPNEIALSPMKSCIYNIDTISQEKDIIICEGPFDVWRMGDNAIATMGTEFTSAQIALIARKQPRNAFVLFDRTAIRSAKKIAYSLNSICSTVEIISIDKKDPAELTEKEAEEIRKQLNI